MSTLSWAMRVRASSSISSWFKMCVLQGHVWAVWMWVAGAWVPHRAHTASVMPWPVGEGSLRVIWFRQLRAMWIAAEVGARVHVSTMACLVRTGNLWASSPYFGLLLGSPHSQSLREARCVLATPRTSPWTGLTNFISLLFVIRSRPLGGAEHKGEVILEEVDG